MCLCASDDMMREVTREMTVQRVQSLISQYIHLKEEMQKNAKQNVPGIENWAKNALGPRGPILHHSWAIELQCCSLQCYGRKRRLAVGHSGNQSYDK